MPIEGDRYGMNYRLPLTPISQGERVGKLDIIRGFALLGILLAHREVVLG